MNMKKMLFAENFDKNFLHEVLKGAYSQDELQKIFNGFVEERDFLRALTVLFFMEVPK